MAVVAGLLVAFGGGIVSFGSPCVLPLVPIYLSVISGLDVAAVGRPNARERRILTRDTLAFVSGFVAVFVAASLTATAVGRSLGTHHLLLTRVAGGVVVALALYLAASSLLRSSAFGREWHLAVDTSRLGPFAAPLAGAAFAVGWTPCITPILASVLAVASTQESLARGVALLVAYGLGLGVPFLAVAAFADRTAGLQRALRRFSRPIGLVSAALLVGLGLLLLANRLSFLTTLLEGHL